MLRDNCAFRRVFFPHLAPEYQMLWFGMLLGGIVLSVIGSGSAFLLEKKAPTAKGVVRDFLIGAIMVAFIMQLLPESAGSIISSVMAWAPLSAVSLAPSIDDMEVQVGVPKF